MTSPMRLTSVLLVAAAAVLVGVHLTLDAGDDREAPRWVLVTAVAVALLAVLVAVGALRAGTRRPRDDDNRTG
jgi:hypothetical protein